MALLRELFYFDKDTGKSSEDDRYDAQYDDSPLQYNNTRKTRLTLRDINRIRKASDLNRKESEKDLVFIRRMYQMPIEGGGL